MGNRSEGFAHISSLSSRKKGRALGSRPRIWDHSRIPLSQSAVNFSIMDVVSGKG